MSERKEKKGFAEKKIEVFAENEEKQRRGSGWKSARKERRGSARKKIEAFGGNEGKEDHLL